jgi:ketosteroid isomerase-like protein
VVVVDTRAKGIGEGSGVPIEMDVHIVLRFQDQKIVWSQGFIDRDEALEAAGLRE